MLLVVIDGARFKINCRLPAITSFKVESYKDIILITRTNISLFGLLLRTTLGSLYITSFSFIHPVYHFQGSQILYPPVFHHLANPQTLSYGSNSRLYSSRAKRSVMPA